MARQPAAAKKPAASKKQADRRTPLVEKAAAALGLLLILGVLGVLAADLTRPRTPPELVARLVDVQPSAAGFVARVEVANGGRATAQGVEVEGVLTPSAGPAETATASLDYVPGRGGETVSFQFRADPRAGDLELTVRGWSEP